MENKNENERCSPDIEREAFIKAMKHLDCVEMPDAWGRPMFQHSHVQAMWDGWKAHAAAQHARCSAGIDSLREEIGKALYVRNHGPNPDWPIGVDKLGYQQEPYVKHVPAWEWFHGGDADAVLSVIHGVAQSQQEQK